MSPYKRSPRRYFTDQMHSPYFRTNHYNENHIELEKKIENLFLKIIKKILRKNKGIA